MTAVRSATVRPARCPGMSGKLGLLFLMFLLQKIFLCFTWTLVPILMRTQGQSLGTIGLTALIYCPWALKFLPAPWVDQFHSPALGRRKTWIIPLVVLFLAIQVVLSMIRPETGMPLVLAVIFVLNVLSATMDIAMDAYATDILLPEERPWGNTVQTMGYTAGYMTGAGIFLMVYPHLGWQATLWSMTALQGVLALPVLLHREIPPVRTDYCRPPGQPGPGIRAFVSRPHIRWFIPFLLIAVLMDQGGDRLHLPMMVDKGYDPAGLGRLILWFGSCTAVLGAAAGSALFRRSRVRTLFFLACMGAGGLNLCSAFLFQVPLPSPLQVGILLGAEKFISGSVTVLLYTMVMGFSAGPASATGNAVLHSLIHLFMLGTAPIAGMICDHIGFYPLFLGLGLAAPLLFPAGDALLQRSLALSPDKSA